MIVKNNIQKIKIKIDPKQSLTSFAGLSWLHSLIDRLNLESLLARGYGIKSRNRCFSEADYFRATLALFLTGGHSISDISRLDSDPIVTELFSSGSTVPTDSAICKFYHEATPESVKRMASTNRKVVKDILKRLDKSGRSLGKTVYAFMDSSELEVYGKRFEGAGINYNGDCALRLHTLFLDNLLVSSQLHDIHHSPSFGWEGLLEDLQNINTDIDNRIHILLDSAYYNHKLLQRIIDKNWFFSVTCRWCADLEREASIIEESYWENDTADFYYRPAGFTEPQRVVVHRSELRETEGKLLGRYKYYFVMTNSGGQPSEIIYQHRFRAGEENRLKDLLSGFGLHHPRFMSLNANRLHYQVGAIAYNLLQAAKFFILDRTKHFFVSVRSFIYRFVIYAGRIIRHEWRKILKLSKYPLCLQFIDYRLMIIPPG